MIRSRGCPTGTCVAEGLGHDEHSTVIAAGAAEAPGGLGTSTSRGRGAVPSSNDPSGVMLTWLHALSLMGAVVLSTISRTPPPQAKSPSTAQGAIGWLGFLTSAHDYDIWLDASPLRLRKDPTYGPILTEALAKLEERIPASPCVYNLFIRVSHAERVVLAWSSTKAGGVLVVGGLPSDFDVAKFTCNGNPVWFSAPPNATGIRELSVREPQSDTTMLMLPDGTVVVGMGESAKPVHALLERSKAPAFPTETSGKLGELHIRGGTLAAARIRLEGSALAPALDSLSQMAFTAWSNQEGRIALHYSDGDHAERAWALLQRAAAAAPKDETRLSFSPADSAIFADLPRSAVEQLLTSAHY